MTNISRRKVLCGLALGAALDNVVPAAVDITSGRLTSPDELLKTKPPVVIPALLRVSPGPVIAGVERQFKEVIGKKQSFELNILSSDTRSTDYVSENMTSTDLKQTFAAGVSAGFSIASLVPTGNAHLDFSLSRGITSTTLTRFSEEDKKNADKRVKEFEESYRTAETSTGDYAGYIKSELVITTTFDHPVTIKDVVVAICEIDPFTGRILTSEFSTVLMNGDVGGVHRPKDAEIPAAIDIRPNSPGIEYRATIYLRNLNTSQIMEIAASKALIMQVNSYTLVDRGKEVFMSNVDRALADEYIGMLLTNEQGRSTPYFVKTDATRSNVLSLADALQRLGIGRVQIDTHEGKPYIRRIGNATSDFTVVGNPAQYKSVDLNEGAWFVSVLSPGFRGGLTDPAPAGTHFAVTYLTKGDLLSVARATASKVFSLSEGGTFAVDTLTSGDVVTLEFNPQHSRFHTYTTNGFETINTSNSGSVDGDRGLLKATDARVYYVSEQLELMEGKAPGDYGLVLLKSDDAVSKIDLNKVTLIPSGGYQVEANGTVHVTFIIDQRLLGNDHSAAFNIHCLRVINNLRLGRDLNDALIATLGGHDRQWVRDWRDVQPQFRLRTEPVEEIRRYRGRIVIQSSIVPKP